MKSNDMNRFCIDLELHENIFSSPHESKVYTNIDDQLYSSIDDHVRKENLKESLNASYLIAIQQAQIYE